MCSIIVNVGCMDLKKMCMRLKVGIPIQDGDIGGS